MKKEPEYRPRAECAYAPHCTYYAMGQRKLKTGWANLCISHLDMYDTAYARKWCEEQGLASKETQLDFVREQVKLLDRPKDPKAWMRNARTPLAVKWRDEYLSAMRIPSADRIPGEDDEVLEQAA